MVNINVIFSDNLKKYMEINDITQVELAESLGVSQASVSQWCIGKKLPKMGRVDQLCRLLHCNRSDLITDGQSYEIKPLGELYDNIDNVTFNKLANFLSKLNQEGQEEALKRIEDLTYNPKYTAAPSSEPIKMEILGGNPE